MPPDESNDPAYLWDMLQAAQKVQAFVRGKTYEQYLMDEMLQAAVERKIEIIGEAARRISETTRQGHPEIDWRPIVAQRHILAHEYGEILQERIWRVATFYIPALIENLRRIVPSP